MLSIQKIRENPNAVKIGLKKRDVDFDLVIDRILELDIQIRSLKTTIEAEIRQRNKITKENGKLFGMKKRQEKKGESTAEVDAKIAENTCVAKKIDEEEATNRKDLETLSAEYRNAMLSLPNLPDTDLLPGGKENNEPLRSIGEIRSFDFCPKHHSDLCMDLDLINYSIGISIAGNGNPIYTGMGARLEWALMNYCIDSNIAAGYTFLLPPHILKYKCGEISGRFLKKEFDAYEIYKIEDNEIEENKTYLMPSAEDAVIALYNDQILSSENLPNKICSYSIGFQRDKYNKQLNNVEMFQITRPEDSDEAFEELLKQTEALVIGLGLHFRTVKLAAGECPFSMSRSYGIEILLPSMNGYKEVSSVSNARDYQARRGNIRYRRADGKIDFVHTLNGSGLATSRIFPAIVEQNQRADGSIVVPEVLRKYLGGIEVITK